MNHSTPQSGIIENTAEIENRIIEIISRYIPDNKIEPESKLFENGIDSFSILCAGLNIEEIYDVSLPFDVFDINTSPRSMANFILNILLNGASLA